MPAPLQVSFKADYIRLVHFWLTKHQPVLYGWQISLRYYPFLPGGNTGVQLKETPRREAVEELEDQILNPALGVLRNIDGEITACSKPKWLERLQEGPSQGPREAGQERARSTPPWLANRGANPAVRLRRALAAPSRNGAKFRNSLGVATRPGKDVCLGGKSW